MKPIKDLETGFSDAENYKRRENKDLLNKIFIKNDYLDSLCEPNVSFLIGEKGTGKTAYSVFLSNNNYKNILATTKYIRETEYQKFVALKKEKHLTLSEFSSIWKIIIYLLIAKQIIEKEPATSQIFNFINFRRLNDAIDEYYANAFSPEIIQALSFIQESKTSAELIAKHLRAGGEDKTTVTFVESKFQINLFYIQRQFEQALSQLKLAQSHLIFIDGIDIRPSSIAYEDYLECIKGLANAVWEINNDFFPTIRDSKGRLRAVLLIRPDIFEKLGLQNQNTKIRDNSVFLDWRTDYINHRHSGIFAVVDNLLKSQQSDANIKHGDAWDAYFPWNSPNVFETYDRPTSFLSFIRWSYYRPRDFVTMLDLLRENAKSNPQKVNFTSEDFEDPHFKRQYSNYLLGEVKDHLSFYYGPENYEAFLKFFEFLSGHDKFDYQQYSTAFKKLENHVKSLASGTPRFMATANDFLQFLYDLNVICYIERTEQHKPFIHWCFKDRNYANISPKVKTGVEYEIFYGLAKALNVGKTFKGQDGS